MVKNLPRKYDDILAETQALDYEEFTRRIARHQQNLGPGEPEGNYAQLFLAGVQKTGQSYETIRVSKLRYRVSCPNLPIPIRVQQLRAKQKRDVHQADHA